MKDNVKWMLMIALCTVVSVRATAQSWSLTGNAGTNPSVHFIGTSDKTDFKLKTDGKLRMILRKNGNVGIGTNYPLSKLHVNGTITDKWGNSQQWADAYSWGNHALAGYLTSESDPQVGANSLGFVPRWNGAALESGSIYDNGTNIGIGDNTPVATLTVGNGDKLQIHGADGDIVFNDDQGSLRFPACSGTNAPMIQLFSSGTNNPTRMFVAHSPNFPTWGIEYNDTTDAFTWIGDNIPVLQVQLAGQQRVGIGTNSPESKFQIKTNSATGFGHVKLTEDQFDFSRITFNNTQRPTYWDLAARTDTNLANASLNFYHSGVGDVFTINARGRIGINDASPSYTLDIDGNESTRVINVNNTLPTTSNTTYNYGIRCDLSQATNNGFPRLYNFYGISTDADAYLSYAVYAYASGASSNNYGIYAYAPSGSGYAGYFSGNTYCTGSYLTSDPRFKKNVRPCKSGLDRVMALHPVEYEFRKEEYGFMNLPGGKQAGFLSSELKEVMPELVQKTFQAYDEAKSDTEEGQGMWFDAVNYTGLIPVLVSAMQEQQQAIERLKADNELLLDRLGALSESLASFQGDLERCCAFHADSRGTEGVAANLKAHLAQNVPNPYREKTVIRYFLPPSGEPAVLRIMDAAGRTFQQYDLAGSGYGQVEISGGTLAPGIYVYEMTVGNRVIDSKKMVLEK